jgi:voltage-gated potassium channel
VTTASGRHALEDPDLKDRLCELLEHGHHPRSIGSRFVQLIIAVIMLDVLAL